jgi:hypothetical protein
MSTFFNISAQESSDDDKEYEKYIGKEVVAKLSSNKLMQKVEAEADDPTEIIEDFVKDGGVVVDVEGINVIIEADNGETFSLPRFCVTLRK